MKNHMNDLKNRKRLITRKRFLNLSLTALAGTPVFLSGCCRNKDKPEIHAAPSPDPASWWRAGGYIVHDSVDTTHLDHGMISAKIEGSWTKFRIVELPEQFVSWSLSERANSLERLATHGFNLRDLAGPHNACVATFGGPKRDSAVSLNTAYKGMGFVPRKERLYETLNKLKDLKSRIEAEYAGDFRRMMISKTRELGGIYSDGNLFDATKQVSLELFTSRGYFTHTFLNMMANPIASASFLAFPAFELRAVPQLLHPANPDLSDYERGLLLYTNEIHNFIHGGTGIHIACVYHIIEVFDDTPNGNAIGRRLV